MKKKTAIRKETMAVGQKSQKTVEATGSGISFNTLTTKPVADPDCFRFAMLT
jgi:hypothetical protein